MAVAHCPQAPLLKEGHYNEGKEARSLPSKSHPVRLNVGTIGSGTEPEDGTGASLGFLEYVVHSPKFPVEILAYSRTRLSMGTSECIKVVF